LLPLRYIPRNTNANAINQKTFSIRQKNTTLTNDGYYKNTRRFGVRHCLKNLAQVVDLLPVPRLRVVADWQSADSPCNSRLADHRSATQQTFNRLRYYQKAATVS